MKRKEFLRALQIRILVVCFFSVIAFSACSDKDEQVKQIISYLESLNGTKIKIEEVLLSERFIAKPDSIEFKEFEQNIKDTTVYGMEQRILLGIGSEVYFSSFWNKGDIVEKQIMHIKNVSAQYNNIGIKPSSYILFALIQCCDIYGQRQIQPIAFLINSRNEILKHKKVEICEEVLNMFDKHKIEQLLK